MNKINWFLGALGSICIADQYGNNNDIYITVCMVVMFLCLLLLGLIFLFNRKNDLFKQIFSIRGRDPILLTASIIWIVVFFSYYWIPESWHYGISIAFFCLTQICLIAGVLIPSKCTDKQTEY